MSEEDPSTFNDSTNYSFKYSLRTYRSDHPGGVQFAMLDGSVQFISTDSDPAVRHALVTRAGEETNKSFQ